MAQAQTAKEQYDELIADLKAGTHKATDKNRPVQVWDEYDVNPGEVRAEARLAPDGSTVVAAVPHPYAGKHVVTIQYGGPEGGDGGLLKDFAFDPEQIKAEVAPEKSAVKEKVADGGKQ